MNDSSLPGSVSDIYFGVPGRPLPDWRKQAAESGTDDDAPATMEERRAVAGMLGFDPAELDESVTGTLPNRLPVQKALVRKATSADVLRAVRELGGESRWVPLHRLGPKLGMAPAELHATVTQLRRSGELTAQAVEGRGGLSADEQRWAQLDPFGSGRVGAVMLRP